MRDDRTTLEKAVDLVSTEALRRLKKGNAEEIPNHVLFKFYSDLNRTADRRAKEEEEFEGSAFHLLDEIPTLPKDRARKLLEEEIERIRDDLVLHEQALERLEVGGVASSVEQEAVTGAVDPRVGQRGEPGAAATSH